MLFAKCTKAYRQLLENNTYCFVNNDFTSLSFNMKKEMAAAMIPSSQIRCEA